MVLTDRDDVRVAETDEEPLTFDVSDDALEHAANIIGGQATPVTNGVWDFHRGQLACPV